MKKIIVPKVLEEAEYYCDKHPSRRCYSELKTASGYGSNFDMMGLEIHLCDECLTEMFKFIRKKFGVEPTNIRI